MPLGISLVLLIEPMSLDPTNAPEKLEYLLDWLDPDREQASRQYLSIRTALVKIFESRGCNGAEDLADQSIDRVMEKVELVAKTFEGNPARYFYGVAKNVLHEQHRRRRSSRSSELLPEPGDQADATIEQRFECLDKCLLTIDTADAELIRRYYSYAIHEKAKIRSQMAKDKGVSISNLRIRAFRIRKQLRECLEGCFKKMVV